MADNFDQFGTPVGASPASATAPTPTQVPTVAPTSSFDQFGAPTNTTVPTATTPPVTNNTPPATAGPMNPAGALETVENVGQGIGHSLMTSVAGAEDLISKAIPKAMLNPETQQKIHNVLHNFAESTLTNRANFSAGPVVEVKPNTAQTVGGMVGDLIPFMKGEKVFDALAHTDQILEAVKAAKVLEKYPKVQALIRAGISATRAATVQGAQTLVNTGGDVKQAAESAGTMGAISGALGVPAELLSSIAPKVGEAGETYEKMRKAADAAPTKQEVAANLQEPILSYNATADASQKTSNAAANTALEDQVTKAKGDAEAWTKAEEAKHAENVTKAQQDMVQSLNQLSAGAKPPEEMAEAIDQAINETEKAAHTKYEAGITGENGIETRIGQDVKNPAKGGPISEAAADALKAPVPEDDLDVAMAKRGAGEVLKPNVQNFLQALKDGEIVQKGEGEAEDTVVPIKDRNVHSLVQLRQSIRAFADQFQRGDPNKRALQSVLGSVDDEIQQLAGKADSSGGVLDDYKKLRNDYKETRANLDSATADKLTLNKPDKAMQDVGKWAMTGNNAPAKIATMRKAAGGAIDDLAKSTVQGWKTMAEEDPNKFLKEFDKIPNPTKQAMFGPEMAQSLQDTADGYRNAVSNSEAIRDQSLAAAKVSGKAAEKTAKVSYEEALQDSQDKAKETLTPTSSPLMKDLAEGRVNANLFSGKVDVKDIQNIKQVIGQENWDKIFDQIVQTAVKDATIVDRVSKTGAKSFKAPRFAPDKFLNWVRGIDPQVLKEMTGGDRPEAAAKFQDLMDKMDNAAKAKKWISTGLLYGPAAGIGGGTFAAANALIPGFNIAGLMGGLLGAATGIGGTRVKAIRETVDYLADHPDLWSTLNTVGKINKVVAPVAKPAIKKAITNAVGGSDQYNGASGMAGVDNK